MIRRRFLQNMGLYMLAPTAAAMPSISRDSIALPPAESESPVPLPAPSADEPVDIKPIRAEADRIIDVSAGLRPFRHAGPRMETERLGPKTIVHNYGHGGAGWSLSWGASTLALRMAQAAGASSIAVIGCGAMGLTSAILAQRAGLPVCIYTKSLPPEVYSMSATGMWTPDSQLCAAEYTPSIAERWAEMAKISFKAYQDQLGMAGTPIEWVRGFSLSDTPFGVQSSIVEDEPEYGKLRDPLHDFIPRLVGLCPGSHPFPQAHVRGWTTLIFNISAYAHGLMNDFLAAGGKIKVCEFTQTNDLLLLQEDTIINASGYGARKLFNDNSLIPIRGQTARLIPQPEVDYGLSTPQLTVVPRRDGILVQSKEERGNFNNSDDAPNRASSEAAVRKLASLFQRMRRL